MKKIRNLALIGASCVGVVLAPLAVMAGDKAAAAESRLEGTVFQKPVRLGVEVTVRMQQRVRPLLGDLTPDRAVATFPFVMHIRDALNEIAGPAGAGGAQANPGDAFVRCFTAKTKDVPAGVFGTCYPLDWLRGEANYWSNKFPDQSLTARGTGAEENTVPLPEGMRPDERLGSLALAHLCKTAQVAMYKAFSSSEKIVTADLTVASTTVIPADLVMNALSALVGDQLDDLDKGYLRAHGFDVA